MRNKVRLIIVPRLLILAVLLPLMALLAACGGTAVEEVPGTPVAAAVEATAVPVEPTESAEGEASVEATAVPVEPTESAEGEALVEATAVAEAVEVLFFTPAQQEGPYYTVQKPADRDNDLVALDGAAGTPAGEVLEFGGTVYDAAGYPIEGALVEIWQTDAAGVYLHPGDPGTENRDRNFQFYGQALTDAQGLYSFRTILPGLYEPRPRHIHVKVRLDGEELLTTQFYFAGELDPQGAEALMLIDTRPDVDEEGNAILVGERDIFLNVHGG